MPAITLPDGSQRNYEQLVTASIKQVLLADMS
jgi:hypothetical protein